MNSAVDKNYQDRLQTLKFTAFHSHFNKTLRFISYRAILKDIELD